LATLAHGLGIGYDSFRWRPSVRIGECEMRMAVRLFLSSEEQRTVDAADSARLDGPFFLVRRSYPNLNRTETVLTLRSGEVIGAEVLQDGVRIDFIPGCGPAKT
jgi:hypothetical protein